MKLRRIVLGWGVAIALAMTVGNIVFSTTILKDGFSEIEKREILSKINAATHALHETLSQLDRLVSDWSLWDDTYAYTQNSNIEYEKSNLVLSTYLDQNLASIIITNAKGRIIYSRAVDSEGADSPQLQAIFEKKTMTFLSSLSPDAALSGLVLVAPHFYMVAARPILTSDGEGPPMGHMVMVRMISEDILESIGKSVGHHIEFTTLKPGQFPLETLKSANIKPVIHFKDDAFAEVWQPIETLDPGIFGVIAVGLARDVTQYGTSVIIYNNILMLTTMSAFLLALIYILYTRVVKRVENLSSQVAQIQQFSENLLAVDVGGTDEIALLANNINFLMNTLHDAHRKQLRQGQEIADNERFLNQVLNSISVGILLVDPASREIFDINDFALKMANRHRHEVVGNICHKLTCPADLDKCPILDLHQPYDRSKRVLLDRDGNRIPILKSVSLVQKQGRELLLETIIDITDIEQSRLELERIKENLESLVAERTEELEKTNRNLIDLSKSKDLFLSSASHELRTPLTSIMGFLKLMERRFNRLFYDRLASDPDMASHADKYIENLAIVRAEAERLGRLVNDLLSLDKINSGKMEWRDELHDVNSLLNNAAEFYSGHSAYRAEVRLVVEPAKEKTTIFADKDKIQQVLINLLNNAYKFTDQGQITLAATPEDEFVRFEVRDTGKGIAEADLKHIFDLFYQIKDVNKRSGKDFGTGLGLSICQQIARHYGGEISVDSTFGVGSTFHFTIPISRQD